LDSEITPDEPNERDDTDDSAAADDDDVF